MSDDDNAIMLPEDLDEEEARKWNEKLREAIRAWRERTGGSDLSDDDNAIPLLEKFDEEEARSWYEKWRESNADSASVDDDNGIELLENFDEEEARSWYEKWRKNIYEWIERRSDSEWAEILLFLPDALIFVVEISRDPRTPLKYRLAILSAIVYVLSPYDILPEAVLGVPGLIDDAGLLIILLDMLFNAVVMEDEVWAQVLRDHWHSEQDPASTIRMLVAKLIKILGNLFAVLVDLVRHWWQGRTYRRRA